MPFQPGQITNPNGARKERKFYQALLIALNAEGPDIRLRKVAEILVKQALKGEAWAIKELADRIDGKVPQAQIIQGDEDGGSVRYIVELPEKSASTQEWLESIRREDAGRSLVTGVAAAVDDEPTH